MPTRKLPPLVWFGLAAVAIDLVLAVMLLSGDQSAGVMLLFQLGWLCSWLGCLEGLNWISTESPWALPRGPRNLEELRQQLREQVEGSEVEEIADPDPGTFDLSGKLARLRRVDFVSWSSLVLRILSGASLMFMIITLFLIYMAPHMPEFVAPVLVMLVLMFFRLSPLGVAALALAPMALAVRALGRRFGPGDGFHAGTAFGASLLTVLQLWLLNQPPLEQFLAVLIQVGGNFFGWPYGIMMGALVWWKISYLSGSRRVQ